jgi:hypothetical protein
LLNLSPTPKNPNCVEIRMLLFLTFTPERSSFEDKQRFTTHISKLEAKKEKIGGGVALVARHRNLLE